jgi:hypothetical protein
MTQKPVTHGAYMRLIIRIAQPSSRPCAGIRSRRGAIRIDGVKPYMNSRLSATKRSRWIPMESVPP